MKKGMAALLMGLALVLLLAGCGCKHEHTEVQNALAASCTEEGYTGDTYCLDCKKVIKKGEAIAAAGHKEGSPVDAYDATCFHQGYTGDVYCQVCGELLSQGEYTAMIDHTPMEERVYASVPTCAREGYTGSVYCENCGERLEEGEVVPMIEHPLGDPENVVEAACDRNGYTGDRTCAMCGEVFEGEELPALEHAYGEDGICADCGYKRPGLYIDGKLSMDWETLVSEGYAVVEDEELVDLQDALYGTIVVSDDLKRIDDYVFYGSNFTEIWIPWSIQNAGEMEFRGSPVLETVRFFCQSTQTPGFYDCPALKHVDLPEGIERVTNSSFGACVALTELDLGDSVKTIEYSAFWGCTALTSINLPEGLETIDESAFRETAIREFVAPASLSYLGESVFRDCPNLTRVDLSACTVDRIRDNTFSNSAALNEVILPDTLTYLQGGFNNCASLKSIVLPEGVTAAGARFEGCTALETLVWPVSLKEIESSFLCDSELTGHLTILYRGDALRWSLINGVDRLAEFSVTMDYQD